MTCVKDKVPERTMLKKRLILDPAAAWSVSGIDSDTDLGTTSKTRRRAWYAKPGESERVEQLAQEAPLVGLGCVLLSRMPFSDMF
mmetsp:Transcript_17685/g.45609  ORF Transcript_17685/g.45609 Transcript_17685/m.45609 type:complete len:85 (-) Transcript_17685:541-795(-)